MWAADVNGKVFVLTDTNTWVAPDGGAGLAKGLNNHNDAIGADNMSSYHFTGTTWINGDWDHWQLLMLGSTSYQNLVGQIYRIAVTLNGSVLIERF